MGGSKSPPRARESKKRIVKRAAPPGAPTGIPDWVARGLETGAPQWPSLRDGVVVSLCIGQAEDAAWFDNLSLAEGRHVLDGVLGLLDRALPGTPKLLVTHGGLLSIDPWSTSAAHEAVLGLPVARDTSLMVGVDGPWAADPHAGGWTCGRQSLVGARGAAVYGPIEKFNPAPASAHYETLRGAGASVAYQDRLLPTTWGPAYGAVCHDLFALRGVPWNYDARAQHCDGVWPREEVVSQMPNGTVRKPALVAHAVHQFKDGKFSRFPRFCQEVADTIGVPVVTAARFLGFEDTVWKAARAPARPGGVPADAHWWVDGASAEWLWLQVYSAQGLGLVRR